MRRAVQQAKAEAAAQAAAGIDQDAVANDSKPTADSQQASGVAVNGKKTLAARLQKAAQQTEEQEAQSAAEAAVNPHGAHAQQADSADASVDDQPHQSDPQDDPLDSEQLQLSGFSQSSTSSSDPGVPLVKTQSLGNKLGSMMKNALSPSRQSSYIPLDADSPPEAEGTNDKQRRAPPHDASLGQKLGSILKGALPLYKQSSYIPLSGEEASDSVHSSSMDMGIPAIPRELSLRERYGSMSISRESSRSFASDNQLSEFGAASELSPGRRRALPRDASYLPEWVTRTHAQTASARGDGSASPRSRLGSRNVSSVSDDGAVPKWVDWPQTSPQPNVGTTPQHTEQQPGDDLASAAPILMAPPHLRKQQQDGQMADVALPRAKRPLAFALNPLALSLVHTPSMNPQMDLRVEAPAPTPKGQRLFDFWHHKSDQPAATPANPPHTESGPAAHTRQHPGLTQLAPPTTSLLAEKSSPISLPQLAGALQNTHQVPVQAAEFPGDQSEFPGDHSAPPANIGAESMQAGTASAALVAELETASRLVHKQSLQQAELLEGLELALSQLSEHRLLVHKPQAAAAAAAFSNEEDRKQSQGMLHQGGLVNVVHNSAHLATSSAAVCMLPH